MASGHLIPYVASANEEVAFSFYFISTNLHSNSSRILRSINKCWVEEKVEASFSFWHPLQVETKIAIDYILRKEKQGPHKYRVRLQCYTEICLKVKL